MRALQRQIAALQPTVQQQLSVQTIEPNTALSEHLVKSETHVKPETLD